MKSQRPAHLVSPTQQRTTRIRTTRMFALLCWLLLVACFTALTASPSAAQEEGEPPAVSLRVIETSSSMDTNLTSLTGGTANGVVSVELYNGTEQRISNAEVLLQVNGRSSRTSVTMDPGDQQVVSLPISFERSEWGPQTLTLSIDGRTDTLTQWNMPWVLIGLVAVLINLVLLGLRNLLRNRVRTQLVAQRRAEDLGGAAPASAGLMPALLAGREIPACDPGGSLTLPTIKKPRARTRGFWEKG